MLRAASFGIVASLLLVQGCTVNDATPTAEATVRSHFFPLDNGLTYTYLRYNNRANDTLVCTIIIGKPGQNPILKIGANDTFYTLSYTYDANGNLAANLANDTMSLMVLDGKLEKGAQWDASESPRVHATVIAQYDDYYLEGRSTHYADVLVVQYHQEGLPSNVYTLRFFARDHGMISERELVGNTEISSLQLISITSPS